MLNTKQIIVIAASVLLLGVLIAQPIKGLVKKDVAENSAAVNEQNDQINAQVVAQLAKEGLNPSLRDDIEKLEEQLKTVPDNEKVALHERLAEKWMDVNKPAPAAFHWESVASAQPNLAHWLRAGDTFTEAYQAAQDTALVSVLTTHAIASYQKALEADSENLDAKTGLGSAYVNGVNPMQGITMLLEVVKQDPKNIKANYNLGLFSMQSRQFDKAVERFKTVVEQKEDPESWFYLATSYENIGLNKEAIEAFKKSEQLAADPSLTQFINRKIEELSK